MSDLHGSRWVRPHGLSERWDSVANRQAMVEILSKDTHESLKATDEGCVIVTKYFDEPLPGWEKRDWLRVARSYNRQVVWFRGDDSLQQNGDIIIVGDAGKGRGWKQRMETLFAQAIVLWTGHRINQGWPF